LLEDTEQLGQFLTTGRPHDAQVLHNQVRSDGLPGERVIRTEPVQRIAVTME
jgi:hypothetical protein